MEAFWLALFGSLPGLVAAIMAALHVRGKVENVHSIINGRYDALTQQVADLKKVISDRILEDLKAEHLATLAKLTTREPKETS